MANKWMTKLQKLDGTVKRDENPFMKGVRSSSPSANFVFGNTHLLPGGFTAIVAGPYKGGKTVFCNSIIGQVHRDDPDALVAKFDTEMRDRVQLTPLQMSGFGIDPDRLWTRETNKPDEIFDCISGELMAMCQEGAPLKLVVIDSATAIMGRRATNADGVMTQQRGDDALTQQDGLKQILSVIRRYNIALILTTQLRAEQDPREIMRGNTTKMAGAFYLKHFGEYFIHVESNRSKDGKTTLDGTELIDETKLDLMDHAEKTGHKIRVCMKESTVGPHGRVGEFTFDYHKGIINTYEEVFLLGTKRGVVSHPNNRSYVVDNFPKEGESSKWASKGDFLTAIKDNDELYKEIVKRVKEQDLELMTNGVFNKEVSTVIVDDADDATSKNTENNQ